MVGAVTQIYTTDQGIEEKASYDYHFTLDPLWDDSCCLFILLFLQQNMIALHGITMFFECSLYSLEFHG